MSESSTETPDSKTAAESVEAGSTEPEKMVPAKAVAKERSEKRAARDEAAKLREDLAEATKRAFGPEEMTALMDQFAATTKQVVDEQLAEIKAERDRYQIAVEFGLNAEQAAKIQEIRGENPKLSAKQALLLAREDHKDMFPSSQATAGSVQGFGGLPVGGASPLRTNASHDNFVQKMREAREKGDVNATIQNAAAELRVRIHRMLGVSPR